MAQFIRKGFDDNSSQLTQITKNSDEIDSSFSKFELQNEQFGTDKLSETFEECKLSDSFVIDSNQQIPRVERFDDPQGTHTCPEEKVKETEDEVLIKRISSFYEEFGVIPIEEQGGVTNRRPRLDAFALLDSDCESECDWDMCFEDIEHADNRIDC